MKRTRNHGGIENGVHDWISRLPDEVLAHILSFLRTKEAVQTCFLSKRWRKTWAIVPVLNFNIDKFLMDDQIKNKNLIYPPHPLLTEVVCDLGVDSDSSAPSSFFMHDPDVDSMEEGRKSVARFERFMHGVLDNRESTNMDIVRYSRQIQRCEALIPMEWLDRVALLMPRVIYINIYGVNMFEVDLPDLLFSCASLQHLVLEFFTVERLSIKPMSIYLPSLKVLELSGVDLLEDFAQKLFMGCPSLERLYLCSCDLFFSCISSMKLKKLSIVSCYQFKVMRISCPDLVSLFIISGHQGRTIGILLKDMTSLVNATVELRGPWYSGDDDNVSVLNLFGSLSNVSNLDLLVIPPELKGQKEQDILNSIKFNNLKKLSIAIPNMSYDILMACFLKHSPNLQELTWTLFKNPGGTLQELLGEMIKITGDTQQEVLGDVSFQHEYLETVKINSWRNPEWASELIKTLDKYVKKIGNIFIS